MVNDRCLELASLMGNGVSAARALWLLACLLLCGLSAVLAVNPVAAQQAGGDTAQQDLKFWEELAFWETVKDSQNPEEFEAYLLIYPDGRFAPLARVRIKALRDQQGAEASAGGMSSGSGQNGSTPPPTADSVFRDCSICPLMAVIPPGEFTMGSDKHRREEQPLHQVTIGAPFALGIYEITLDEWDACVREGGCRYEPESGDPALPVGNLSWDDAQSYVRWLSNKTGFDYRLPSEAEWEYAARAESETVFWWGDEPGRNRANCKDCGSEWSGKGPAPVGSFEPNPFGLYDVHGNLWEWTADCWNANYKGAPSDGSARTKGDCLARVLRGGAWQLDADYMRSARRSQYDRDVRYYLNGLRVAKTLP